MWHVMKESYGGHKGDNGAGIEAVTADMIKGKRKRSRKRRNGKGRRKGRGVSNDGGLEFYFHLWKPPRPTVW